MKRKSFVIFLLAITAMFFAVQSFAAESLVRNNNYTAENQIFPDISDENAGNSNTSGETQPELSPAIWPFGNGDDSSEEAFKPKSPRKAFFLSLIKK